LLEAHATVVVPSRNEGSLQKLRASMPSQHGKQLITINDDVGDEKGAERIVTQLRTAYGGLDHVVASLGSFWMRGDTTKQSVTEFHHVLNNLVGTHFAAARALLPFLCERKDVDTSYTIITAGAAEVCIAPAAGLTTVGAAALTGLSLALRSEYAKQSVRVNEFRVYDRVMRDHELAALAATNQAACAGVVSNIACASHIVRLLTDRSVKGIVRRFRGGAVNA